VVARRALRRAGIASADIATPPDPGARGVGATREAAVRLVERYGVEAAAQVAGCADDDAPPVSALPTLPDSEVTLAELRHAVRTELATTLADVVLRRTGLGSAGLPPARTLQACAQVVGRELGWDEARTQREVDGLSHGWPWAPGA
jgi:glycerol-3-phosphate dehydrogenase